MTKSTSTIVLHDASKHLAGYWRERLKLTT